MSRALLSVSNKTGLIDLAEGLRRRGLELVSTGGTARALAEAGLPVTNVSDVTRFPEMMDGRVKTLHPLIHGGILARRDRSDDLDAANRHGIGLIDVVVVNLYPFVETAAKPDVTFEALIEQIDIGGPSMVRAAAKNFHDVLVVVDPADYASVLAALDAPGGADASLPVRPGPQGVCPHGRLRHRDCDHAGHGRHVRGRLCPAGARRSGTATPAGAGPAQVARPPLRREPAPEGRLVRPRARRLWRGGRPAGQGAVLHQPARPRLGRAHRARVHRAGRRRHQAHQPVRSGHRGFGRRRVRPGARRRCAGRIWRDRRPQPPHRRRDRQRHHLDFHRSRHRPRHRRRRAAADGQEAQHAGRRRELRPAARRDDTGGPLDSGRRPGPGARRGVGGARRMARCARPPRWSPSALRRPRNGRHCALRGASART